MPRKVISPAVQALTYFETAELAAADLVYQFAGAALAKRHGLKAKPVSRQRASVPAASLESLTPPIHMPEPKGPPVVSAAKPRSRRMRAAPSTQEQDVSLPGMPGPVPVVGG